MFSIRSSRVEVSARNPAWLCVASMLALGGCAGSPADPDDVAAVVVSPLVRMVSTSEFEISINDSRRYHSGWHESISNFDQKFRVREPESELLRLECDGLEAIGVVFTVTFEKKPLRYAGRPMLRFMWSHSAHDGESPALDYRKSPYRSDRKKKLYHYSTLLGFKRGTSLRRDGRLRLSVTYRGREIYTDGFELVGCEQGPER